MANPQWNNVTAPTSSVTGITAAGDLFDKAMGKFQGIVDTKQNRATQDAIAALQASQNVDQLGLARQGIADSSNNNWIDPTQVNNAYNVLDTKLTNLDFKNRDAARAEQKMQQDEDYRFATLAANEEEAAARAKFRQQQLANQAAVANSTIASNTVETATAQKALDDARERTKRANDTRLSGVLMQSVQDSAIPAILDKEASAVGFDKNEFIDPVTNRSLLHKFFDPATLQIDEVGIKDAFAGNAEAQKAALGVLQRTALQSKNMLDSWKNKYNNAGATEFVRGIDSFTNTPTEAFAKTQKEIEASRNAATSKVVTNSINQAAEEQIKANTTVDPSEMLQYFTNTKLAKGLSPEQQKIFAEARAPAVELVSSLDQFGLKFTQAELDRYIANFIGDGGKNLLVFDKNSEDLQGEALVNMLKGRLLDGNVNSAQKKLTDTLLNYLEKNDITTQGSGPLSYLIDHDYNQLGLGNDLKEALVNAKVFSK